MGEKWEKKKRRKKRNNLKLLVRGKTGGWFKVLKRLRATSQKQACQINFMTGLFWEIVVFRCTLFLSILTIKLHEEVLPSQDLFVKLLLSTQPSHVHQIIPYLLKFCKQLINRKFALNFIKWLEIAINTAYIIKLFLGMISGTIFLNHK